MNAFAELRDASLGWLDLIAGRPEAEGKFAFNRRGLINAAGFYVVVVLLGIAVTAAVAGFPGPVGLILGTVVNLLPLGAFWLVAWGGGRVLNYAPLPVLVAGTYALAFVLLVGLVLSLVLGDALSTALLGALCYMLYRLGRGVAGLNIGRSLGFALVSIVVLVGVPRALYMLTGGGCRDSR